jgi:hypothetical protein
MMKHALAAVAVALLLTCAADAKDPTVRLNRGTFDVEGLAADDLAALAKVKWTAAEWNAVLAVHVENNAAGPDGPPAVFGTYRVEDGVLRFEPRFPPSPGLRYRVTFNPSKLPGHDAKERTVTAEFAIPKPPAVATAVVEQVYPTAKVLPENQLRFYLHFSAPMSVGDSYKYVKLLNEAGKEVESPFLELGEELWDRDGKRFTLLIHPGRIKRGLKPREELGPVLEEGKSYTLVVSEKWPDAEGNPLKEGYKKTFRAAKPIDEGIDSKTWKLRPPDAGTRDPLTVTFPAPLDHALLQRVVWVADGQGERVAGKVTVSEEETRWQFAPEKPWKEGEYQLTAETILEDLAGNRIGRPFEVDVLHPIEKEITTKTVGVPFRVKPDPKR